jgi:hypothetical protein
LLKNQNPRASVLLLTAGGWYLSDVNLTRNLSLLLHFLIIQLTITSFLTIYLFKLSVSRRACWKLSYLASDGSLELVDSLFVEETCNKEVEVV